jgi:hypothetical protein
VTGGELRAVLTEAALDLDCGHPAEQVIADLRADLDQASPVRVQL